MKYFAWIVIGFVAAAVVSALVVMGAPTSRRAERFDEWRVMHLQSIQGDLVSYWQAKETLPDTLNQLTNGVHPVSVPNDPETGEPYRYRKTGDLSFELCATFTTEAKPEPLHEDSIAMLPDPFYTWHHPAGDYCFTRTIDPEFFTPDKPEPLPRPL